MELGPEKAPYDKTVNTNAANRLETHTFRPGPWHAVCRSDALFTRRDGAQARAPHKLFDRWFLGALIESLAKMPAVDDPPGADAHNAPTVLSQRDTSWPKQVAEVA